MHKTIMRSWAVFAFIGSLLLGVAAHAQVVPTGASSLNSGTISAGGSSTPSSGPGSGDVVGPASAASTSIPTYNGTTGKLIAAGSGLTVPTSGTLNLGILNATGLVTAVGVTTTGQVLYSGVSVDVTTGTNEDFTITPNGTGVIVAGKAITATGTTGIIFSGSTTDVTTGTNEDYTVSPNGTGVAIFGKSVTLQGTTGATFSGSTTDITTGTNETLVVDTNGTGVVQLNDQLVLNGITDDITTGTNEELRLRSNGSGAVAIRSGSGAMGFYRSDGTQIGTAEFSSSFLLRNSNNNAGLLMSSGTATVATIVGSISDQTASTVVGCFGDTLASGAGGSAVNQLCVLGEGLVAVARRQSASCTDNAGAGGVLGGLTLTPTSSVVYITNTDAQGCIVTLSETGAALGSDVQIVVVANTGGTITFPAAANVHAGPTFAVTTGLGLNDSYRIHYADMADDLFVGVASSDN